MEIKEEEKLKELPSNLDMALKELKNKFENEWKSIENELMEAVRKIREIVYNKIDKNQPFDEEDSEEILNFYKSTPQNCRFLLRYIASVGMDQKEVLLNLLNNEHFAEFVNALKDENIERVKKTFEELKTIKNVGHTTLSTWLAIFRDDLFMPIWGYEKDPGTLPQYLLQDFEELKKFVKWWNLSTNDIFELLDVLRNAANNAGVNNMFEVAFYLSKYKSKENGKDRSGTVETRYWVIAPYDSTKTQIFEKVWEYDLSNGTIAVGWKELGDVSGMSKSELESKYKEVYGKIDNKDINAIWGFYHEISIGDIIIARKGRKKIIGIGTVISKPFYNEEMGKERVAYLTEDFYPNFLRVKWEEKEIEFDKQVFSMYSPYEISEEKYYSLLEGEIEEAGYLKEMKNKIKTILNSKKQVILYGPPGTGKTWLAKKFVEEVQEEVKRVEFVTFHPSYSYEEFVEGLKPIADEEGNIKYEVEDGIFKRICKNAYNALMHHAGVDKRWEKDLPELDEAEISNVKNSIGNAPKFFLIIDEINRGDVSKVFGELITLLEADKRLFAENEIITTLPYSKEQFGVPPNLYIIGTMNTADRSIALIDVALRRRFGFIEVTPSYKVLLKELLGLDYNLEIDAIKEEVNKWELGNINKENPSPEDVKMLAIKALYVLNQKIQLIYDRDHQIGHSYLLKLKDGSVEALKHIWYHEVIPLLQEYFYNDWERLRYLLGGFVEEKEVKEFADSELVDSEDAKIYTIRELSDEDFINTMASIAKVKSSQSAE